ncbi:hypothetical protein Tco_0528754 [Tanacetum coccineum]
MEECHKRSYRSSDYANHHYNVSSHFPLGSWELESYQHAPPPHSAKPPKPRWEATGFAIKHDYPVHRLPKAIDEAFDYRVQGIISDQQTNPGNDHRFWTKKDVDRSKDLHGSASRKGLKTRRIFRSGELFGGGRILKATTVLLKRTEEG